MSDELDKKLTWAVEGTDSDSDAVERLLDQGANPNAESGGYPLVTVAARKGHLRTVKLLWNAGAKKPAFVKLCDEALELMTNAHVDAGYIITATAILCVGQGDDAVTYHYVHLVWKDAYKP